MQGRDIAESGFPGEAKFQPKVPPHSPSTIETQPGESNLAARRFTRRPHGLAMNTQHTLLRKLQHFWVQTTARQPAVVSTTVGI